jgi:hypothetical protein
MPLRHIPTPHHSFSAFMLKFCGAAGFQLKQHDLRAGLAVTVMLQDSEEGRPHNELALKHLGGWACDGNTVGTDYVNPEVWNGSTGHQVCICCRSVDWMMEVVCIGNGSSPQKE